MRRRAAAAVRVVARGISILLLTLYAIAFVITVAMYVTGNGPHQPNDGTALMFPTTQPVATFTTAAPTTTTTTTHAKPVTTAATSKTTTTDPRPRTTFTTTTGPTTTWTSPLDWILRDTGVPVFPAPQDRRYNSNQYGCHSDGRCLDEYDAWCDEGEWVYVEQTGEEVCYQTYEWLIDEIEYDE